MSQPPSEAEVLTSSERPVTQAQLVDGLRTLGLGPGSVVIVHTSLSRLGWVIGGAQTVVLALLESVGPTGTVVMPSQSTQLTDPERWKKPPVPADWIPILRAELPAYDAGFTPTRAMGAVGELFRTHPLAQRSSHPIYSFAAVGPEALPVLADHSLEDGLGEASPLARLFERDAFVLMLGLDHSTDTSLHLAEHRCEFPGKADRIEGAPMLVDGLRQWVRYRQLAYVSRDFDALGEDFAAQTGREHRGPVGGGIGRLSRQRDLVEYATTWLPTHRPQSLD